MHVRTNLCPSNFLNDAQNTCTFTQKRDTITLDVKQCEKIHETSAQIDFLQNKSKIAKMTNTNNTKWNEPVAKDTAPVAKDTASTFLLKLWVDLCNIAETFLLRNIGLTCVASDVLPILLQLDV